MQLGLTGMSLTGQRTGEGGSTSAPEDLVLMASRVYGPGWFSGGLLSNGTHTVQNCRTSHYNEVGEDVSRVRVLYGNWYTNGSNEAVGPNPITVRAAIEYPVGVYTPLYDIDGVSRDTLIAAGGLNELAADIAIPDGAQFWVRTRLLVEAGQVWPNTYVADAGLGVQTERATGAADKTTSGTISGGDTGYGPAAILGYAATGNAKVRMAVLGDSIPSASGDTGNDGHGNYGYFGKSLTSRVPGMACSVGGTTAEANAVGGVLARRLRLMYDAGVTHVLVTWSTNDLGGNRTFAQIQADLQAIHAAITAAGMIPVQATSTPRSSSTDAWATTANQTAQFTTHRVNLNTWIRTLPEFVDLAAAVEDSFNGGKWTVTGGANTGDGVHPNAAGHAKMQAALSSWIDAKVTATATAPGAYDNIAPNIINGAAYTVTEGEDLDIVLMADKSAIFTKAGGADAAAFTLTGQAVSFTAPPFDAPTDAGGNNVYDVTFRATDREGDTDDLAAVVEVEEVVSVEAETAAYIARQATAPDPTLTNDLNNLVLALKTGALSGANLLASRLDVLQLWGLDDGPDGLLDVKNYVDCTLVGAPAFTANKGRTSAAGVGMNTGFNPATAHADGTKNFNHDDGFFAFWIGTELGSAGHDVLVDDGSSGAYRLSCRYTNDFHQGAFAHDTLSTYGGVTASVGLWIHERGQGSVDNTHTYRNNVQIGTNSTFGARVDPNIPLGVGGQFNGSAFSNNTGRRYAMFAAGRRLQNANERADFYNAIQAFATARGW